MKLRLRYAKRGKVRFTSHRDTARIWERAMRRAGVPVATSAGFTPRPRLSFGLALPTGAESVAEYLDVEVLDDAMTADDVDDLPGAPRRRAPGRVRGARRRRAPSPGPGRCRRPSRRCTWELGDAGGVRPPRGAVERAAGGGDAAARAGAQGRAPGRRRPPGDPVAGSARTTAHWSPRWRPSGAACDRPSSPPWPSPAPTWRRCGRCGRINGSSTTETGARCSRCRSSCRRPWWAHERGRTWTTRCRGPTPRPAPTRPTDTPGAAGGADAGDDARATAERRAGRGGRQRRRGRPPRKRRRGSRGGQRRRKPDGARRRGDGGDDGDDSPELPEPMRENRPSVEAAERALVRKPQIGDTRPAPAPRRRRPRRRPTPPRRRAGRQDGRPRPPAAAPSAAKARARRRRRSRASARGAPAPRGGRRPAAEPPDDVARAAPRAASATAGPSGAT